MRTLIVAAVAAAALITASFSASAHTYGCKYVWLNGKYVQVCWN